MKKLFFLLCVLFMSISLKVNADELVSAKSAILIENDTGKVLYELNADEPLAPASMTKMMTLLLTMEAIENKTIKLSDYVNVSKEAEGMGGSQVYLKENEKYKLTDIIRSVCIASANDGAVVLAETIGGSKENFVKMMNERAKELNLKNTHFSNSYGLDEKTHKSSARDMAIIARELVSHPLILKYSKTYESHLKREDGTSLWMVNTNKLIRYYEGVDGLKTGYTKDAGYCLAATGVWNKLRLISIVMGEESSEVRNKDTIALLNYGRRNFKLKKIIDKDKSLGCTKIDLGKKVCTNAYLNESVSKLLKINEKENNYYYKVNLKKRVAPVKKGDVVGFLKIYENEKLVEKKKLYSKENIDKIEFKEALFRIFKMTISGVKP